MSLRGGMAPLLVLCLLGGACQAAPTVPTATPAVAPTPSDVATTTGPPTATPATSPPSPTPPTPTVTPTVTPTPAGDLIIEQTLPYATVGDCGQRVTECQQFADVYAPIAGAAGGPYPVAVMMHGRPRKPRDMEALARVVAGAGAVVFNIDYRGVRPVVQEGWPEAAEDIACAMRFARARAADYGGDPSTLVLVGHSYGGYLGPLVALAGDEFAGQCVVGPDVSALPTGFVGIAGNYVVEAEPIWETWYGGSREERPGAWRKGDFRTHIGGNRGLVVRLIHERGDPIIPPRQPRQFHAALRDAGYDTRLRLVNGDEHFALLDPEGNGRLVVPLILELLGLE